MSDIEAADVAKNRSGELDLLVDGIERVILKRPSPDSPQKTRLISRETLRVLAGLIKESVSLRPRLLRAIDFNLSDRTLRNVRAAVECTPRAKGCLSADPMPPPPAGDIYVQCAWTTEIRRARQE